MKANIICGYGASEIRRQKDGEGTLLLSSDRQSGNVLLDVDGISRELSSEFDPLSRDLCEIAAYVYLADKAIPRGRHENWIRNLSFVVAVRDCDRWEEVKPILTNAVGFLSGDNVEFRFVRKKGESETRPVVDQHPASPRADSDCVSLFSGGLDSLAGAVYLIQNGRRPLFASHHASPQLKVLQNKLMQAVGREFDRSFEHLKYRVTSHKTSTSPPYKRKESSHRARSFMFLSFAAAAAAVRGLSDIYICENGVMSLNVPISEARKGSRSTRHAHPLFLRYFNELISALYGRKFSVRNSFAFWTKSEECKLLRSTKLLPQIKHTVTCWGYPNLTLRYKDSNHCGSCLPCIVRRISLIASGLEKYDDRYIFDIFNPGNEATEKQLRNIEDLIFFCNRFAHLSKTELLYEYPELVMVEGGLNGTGEDRIGRIIQVYKEFADEVLSAIGHRNPAIVRSTLDEVAVLGHLTPYATSV